MYMDRGLSTGERTWRHLHTSFMIVFFRVVNVDRLGNFFYFHFSILPILFILAAVASQCIRLSHIIFSARQAHESRLALFVISSQPLFIPCIIGSEHCTDVALTICI